MDAIRAEIDEVDKKILSLFCARMELVSKVAVKKQKLGLDVFDPGREAEKLRAATAIGGESYGTYARQLQQHMMAIGREYQEQLRWSDSSKLDKK